MTKIGIKETKELLTWIWDLTDAIEKSAADGKVDWIDIPNFIPVAQSSVGAFAGIQKVGAELLDLDSQEQAQLMDFSRARFDLSDDQLELLIEDSIDQALGLIRLGRRWSQKK